MVNNSNIIIIIITIITIISIIIIVIISDNSPNTIQQRALLTRIKNVNGTVSGKKSTKGIVTDKSNVSPQKAMEAIKK